MPYREASAPRSRSLVMAPARSRCVAFGALGAVGMAYLAAPLFALGALGFVVLMVPALFLMGMSFQRWLSRVEVRAFDEDNVIRVTRWRWPLRIQSWTVPMSRLTLSRGVGSLRLHSGAEEVPLLAWYTGQNYREVSEFIQRRQAAGQDLPPISSAGMRSF